jgi:hypothetical protein
MIHYGRAERGRIASKNVLERLWVHSTGDLDDECWEMHVQDGNRSGHKRIRLDDTSRIFVHRLAWEAHYAEPIPKGLMVCHHCDNPRCFNPKHLFLGTAKENMDDRIAKGRGPYEGKLTFEERDLITKSTEAAKVLAARYGVTPTRIRQLRKGVVTPGRF